MKTRVLLSLLICLLCIVPVAMGESESSALSVTIGHVETVLPGHMVDVPVIINGGADREFIAFQLGILFPNNALIPTDVIPGDVFAIPGEYEWEYFTYHLEPYPEEGAYPPLNVIHVTGMADSNNGAVTPQRYTIADSTALFTMQFLVSNDQTLQCTYQPIRFLWKDCNDNSFCYYGSFTDKICIGVSAHVYDLVWDTIANHGNMCYELISDYDDPSGFPTVHGFQMTCMDSTSTRYPLVPNTSYFNGGIMTICVEDIDDRGNPDVNLNSVPCEIGDAVIFINSFVYGDDAFTIDVLCAVSMATCKISASTTRVILVLYAHIMKTAGWTSNRRLPNRLVFCL